MVFRLLELPEEFQLSILENIDERCTLCNLARTSRHLQSLAEPLIYRKILVRSQRDITAFESRTETRAERFKYFQIIDARLQENTGALVGLLSAPNVQDVTIESPYCNRLEDRKDYLWMRNKKSMVRALNDSSMPRLTRGAKAPHLTLAIDALTTRQ